MYLPSAVKYIIETLQKNGHEAYAVGGCVRDSILNRNPSDWDITTSALPEQTKELFDKTFDTGIEHGTITALVNGDGYEITTYRIDGDYQDSRRPNQVEFTSSLEEDLLRRDFTINAMAYNDKDGLVDIFGGMDDLKNKTIRCVGDATQRFSEDALRILRAVRFAAQLDFTIEETTAKAIKKLAPSLDKISVERIQVEMIKLLTSNNPDFIMQAYDLGITEIILPEFNTMMETDIKGTNAGKNRGKHTINTLKILGNNKVSRLEILLYNVGKVERGGLDTDLDTDFQGQDMEAEKTAENILKRWKMDNKTIHSVGKLVRHHEDRPVPNLESIRRSIHKIGEDLYPLYLEIRSADLMSQSPSIVEEELALLERTKELYETIIHEKHCVTLKELAVTGEDLIKAGVPQGKEIGEKLQILLDLVLKDHNANQKEHLLKQLFIEEIR